MTLNEIIKELAEIAGEIHGDKPVHFQFNAPVKSFTWIGFTVVTYTITPQDIIVQLEPTDCCYT